MHQILEPACNRDAPNPSLDAAAKRALIETELRTDASRSDREIARVVGVDHKTVGAARERLGIATPLGINSPPVSPWKPETAAAVKEPPYDPFDKDGEDLVVKHQPAIAIYLNPWDAVVIRQRSDDSDDPCIFICEEHLPAVISRLSEILAEFRQGKRLP